MNYLFLTFLLFLLIFLNSSSSSFSSSDSSDSSSPSPLLSSDSSHRIAICFFGLSRSLYYTKKSISSHIFDILKDDNFLFDVYLHTYNQTTINNPRSREQNVTLNTEEWKILKPKKFLIDDGDLFEKTVIEPSLSTLLTHGDPWKEENLHISLRNVMKQLYSIYQVTNLWKKSNNKYDLVIYLRPDVWFFNDINITDIYEAINSNSSSYEIYVPDFHAWGGTNDRFAFGKPNIMEKYGTRYLEVLNYSTQQPLHAETFLHYILKKFNTTIKHTDILFERVRSNGILWGTPIDGKIRNKSSQKYQLSKNIIGEWIATSIPKKSIKSSTKLSSNSTTNVNPRNSTKKKNISVKKSNQTRNSDRVHKSSKSKSSKVHKKSNE